MKHILICATLAIFAISSTSHALEGVALVKINTAPAGQGDFWVLFTHNAATGARVAIDTGWGVGGGCFSPDGKRMAYRSNMGKIKICDNNGKNRREFNFDPGLLTWTSTGHLYWSMDGGSFADGAIHRINVETGVHEEVCRFPERRVERLETSLDGTVGGAMHGNDAGGNYSYCYNLVAKSYIKMANGCGTAMSPAGAMILINGSGNNDGRGDHEWAQLRSYPANAQMQVIHPPVGMAWGDFRFGPTSDAYFVYYGEDRGLGKPGGWIYEIATKQSTHITNCFEICDFWMGALPAPPVNGPAIKLDRTSLTFTMPQGGPVPAGQTVTVTNAGTGTLSTVTVAKDAGATWLTLSTATSGSSQIITNKINTTTLAAAAYQATVTVSGGGAASGTSYTVTLNVGSSVNAPSLLTAAPRSETSVGLSWHDNATDETAFQVERCADSVTWVTAKTTAANETTFVDTMLPSDKEYRYRVRTVRSTAYSGYSNIATVRLSTNPTITITAPTAGVTLQRGSTTRITWNCYKVEKVYIEYSLDDGVDWTLITTARALYNTDAGWQNYQWVVPSVNGPCLIRIREYSNYCLAVSPSFTIGTLSARDIGTKGSPLTANQKIGPFVRMRGASAGAFSRISGSTFRLDGSKADSRAPAGVLVRGKRR